MRTFVSLSRAVVWLLFNGLLDLSFCLFNVIREFHRFLHRVSAKRRSVKAIMKRYVFVRFLYLKQPSFT